MFGANMVQGGMCCESSHLLPGWSMAVEIFGSYLDGKASQKAWYTKKRLKVFEGSA
jgi:hypothetical protein